MDKNKPNLLKMLGMISDPEKASFNAQKNLTQVVADIRELFALIGDNIEAASGAYSIDSINKFKDLADEYGPRAEKNIERSVMQIKLGRALQDESKLLLLELERFYYLIDAEYEDED